MYALAERILRRNTFFRHIMNRYYFLKLNLKTKQLLSIKALIKLRHIKTPLILAIISDNEDSLQNGISTALQTCLAS